MGFTQKPVFTPKSKINSNLYTEGLQYSYADTYKEYVGLYHIYPNGAIYSESSYMSTSVPLIPYVVQGEDVSLIDENGNDTKIISENNSLYYSLTKSRFHRHYPPPYYYPQPSQTMYDQGFFTRQFAQKINDPEDITEISPDELDRQNEKNNPGIDAGIYTIGQLQWTIDGPISEVRKTNAAAIAFLERNGFLTLRKYLSDLDEFHKDYHKIPE